MQTEFTEEIVKQLNEQQNNHLSHEYTCCGKDMCIRGEDNNWGVLIATTEGWICPCGKYKQNWYH